jgi:Holliday junction resolvase RusA-like endonuclease
MDIKKLVTKEQYNHLKKDYDNLVKNKEITFKDFLTKTYKLKT